MIDFLISLCVLITFIWLIAKCLRFAGFSVTLCKEVIALDTEMVGAGPRGCVNMVARVSIVNRSGRVVYDEYVAPTAPVTDYRTPWSGIREEDLIGAKDFLSVQQDVKNILKDSILVGHDLKFDLTVLNLSHPAKDIRDTALYGPFRELTRSGQGQGLQSMLSRLQQTTNTEEILRWEATIDCQTLRVHEKPSLKFLARELLERDIQVGEHSSVEDARAAMDLYLMHEEQWERELEKYSRTAIQHEQQHEQYNRIVMTPVLLR